MLLLLFGLTSGTAAAQIHVSIEGTDPALLLNPGGNPIAAMAGQSASAAPDIPPGPSMQETEEWVKRQLKVIGSDHIVTRYQQMIWGERYEIEGASLSQCTLTMRQVSQHEAHSGDGSVGLAPNRQIDSCTIHMKDVGKVISGSWSVPPGHTDSKASYFVLMSAIPSLGAPFTLGREGYSGGPTSKQVNSIVARVRDQNEASQAAEVFKRAAILCGAPSEQARTAPAAEPKRIIALPATPTTANSAATTNSTGTTKMTNNEVIQLVTAGLSDKVIVTSIRQASAREFDLTPTGLIALKKAGVSDAVMAAMQDAGAPAQPPAATVAPPPQKYDPSLVAPPKPATSALPDNGCSDIEYMGEFQIEGGPGVWIYVATIRSRAAYTKEVDVEFVKNGKNYKDTWNVAPGQKIEARLDVNNTPPTNVRITACR